MILLYFLNPFLITHLLSRFCFIFLTSHISAFPKIKRKKDTWEIYKTNECIPFTVIVTEKNEKCSRTKNIYKVYVGSRYMVPCGNSVNNNKFFFLNKRHGMAKKKIFRLLFFLLLCVSVIMWCCKASPL